MKIEAVIFDWAGTTVDYGCFAPVRTFIEVFKQYGIEVTMEETRIPMGMLKWDHIKTMLEMKRIHDQWLERYGRDWTTEDIDQMHNQFTKNLMGILHEYVDLKPFVLDTIKDLREQHIKIGSTTGYTDEMMSIVVPEARRKGYAPDYWITPNRVNNCGRPYPYMIFHNMEALQVQDVRHVVKVGDTISDIKEAKAAGVLAIGIIEGSSIVGLSQDEYKDLTLKERKVCDEKAVEAYQNAGADYVIQHMGELPAILHEIEKIID